MTSNPQLSIRKAAAIFPAKAQDMSRDEVHMYVLQNMLSETDLMRKHGCIYNDNETIIEPNNSVGHVVAPKREQKTLMFRRRVEKAKQSLHAVTARATSYPVTQYSRMTIRNISYKIK
jgi:hypothetical protein